MQSSKAAIVTFFIAASIAIPVLLIGNPIWMVLLSPAVAMPLAFTIVIFLGWVLGPGLRTWIHGKGRQANWGYLGHTLRGEIDTNGVIWISLNDCQAASGLPLLGAYDRISDRHRVKHRDKGWLISQTGMARFLKSLDGETEFDSFQVGKLRLFLEREVWKTRRG